MEIKNQDFLRRAESLVREAQIYPWKAAAALVWVERAAEFAKMFGNLPLSESLTDYAGCLRATISRYRLEVNA